MVTLSVLCRPWQAVPMSEVAQALTDQEVARYSRHLIMPEVGMDGQLKLKASSVLCIGAGGLGSPVALYLGRSRCRTDWDCRLRFCRLQQSSKTDHSRNTRCRSNQTRFSEGIA